MRGDMQIIQALSQLLGTQNAQLYASQATAHPVNMMMETYCIFALHIELAFWAAS